MFPSDRELEAFFQSLTTLLGFEPRTQLVKADGTQSGFLKPKTVLRRLSSQTKGEIALGTIEMVRRPRSKFPIPKICEKGTRAIALWLDKENFEGESPESLFDLFLDDFGFPPALFLEDSGFFYVVFIFKTSLEQTHQEIGKLLLYSSTIVNPGDLDRFEYSTIPLPGTDRGYGPITFTQSIDSRGSLPGRDEVRTLAGKSGLPSLNLLHDQKDSLLPYREHISGLSERESHNAKLQTDGVYKSIIETLVKRALPKTGKETRKILAAHLNDQYSALTKGESRLNQKKIREAAGISVGAMSEIFSKLKKAGVLKEALSGLYMPRVRSKTYSWGAMALEAFQAEGATGLPSVALQIKYLKSRYPLENGRSYAHGPKWLHQLRRHGLSLEAILDHVMASSTANANREDYESRFVHLLDGFELYCKFTLKEEEVTKEKAS